MTPREDYAEALHRIREAKETGALELDLSRLKLKRLPRKFKRLTLLQTLNLSRCTQLSDLSPLASLTSLQTLNLSRRTQLSDLSPLAGLTSLQTLDLSEREQLSDLSPLASLTSLQTLNLSRCTQLSDLSPLASLTSLQTLNLSWCTQLSDLSPLASLTSLQTLDLSECTQLNDLSPLASLTLLQTLDLSWCKQLSDLSPLASLTSLQTLNLSRCTQLSDLSPLASLTSLQTLNLSRRTQLSDLSPLAGLTSLQTLDLSEREQLSDLSPLASLTSLQKLYLSRCTQLSDLSPLASLTSLQTLNLSRCTQLNDLSPLASLTSLQKLDLSGCWQLSDLSPLAGLTSLQKLDLSGCEQLSDFSPLAGLTSLQLHLYKVIPKGGAPISPDHRSISILYATNRAWNVPDSDKVVRFSSKRSRNLTYGSAIVRVPKSHKFGHVERPAHLSIWGITVWTEKKKDSKHFTLQMVARLTQEEFTENIKKNKESSALLFVHGYNTDFREAIFRLAQIAWDTQYHGIPVAFSWPSKGGIADYDYDRESALFSRAAFLQVLDLLSKNAKVSKIYVVAHSMGNQIVVDALAHSEGFVIPLVLSEVVLAAPDVDRDVFESLIPLLISKAKGITLYASAADKALLASQLKAQGPRAGYISSSGPLILPGMETIDVTAVGEDMFALNHDAYSGVRSVLDDIGRLLINGTHPPDLRSPQIRGVPEGSAKPDYWRYPQ